MYSMLSYMLVISALLLFSCSSFLYLSSFLCFECTGLTVCVADLFGKPEFRCNLGHDAMLVYKKFIRWAHLIAANFIGGGPKK